MTIAEFAELIGTVNTVLAFMLWICCAYRLFYILVPFFKKIGHKNPEKLHSYAILISARNEENVIENLLESIRSQDYPSELIHTFVIADNCTDSTAEIARNAGATVYERTNKEKVGKGYALNALLENIAADFGKDNFDGYFVIDADNLLTEHYISEMNKTFSDGYSVVTSYRNSKNYGDNWISSGYALWFLHEAKYLNHSRAALGTSCAVSGTGFMFSKEILSKADGWNFFLLTEDIEFSIWNVLNGEKIGYCPRAMLYDEQPTSFRQSWRQRLRWAKGYVQVLQKYGLKLFAGIFRKNGFACFDMAMSILPAVVFTILGFALDIAAAAITLACGGNALPILLILGKNLSGAYLSMFFLGIFPLVSEWKRIRTTSFKKILSLFTFPVFMMTYLPISFTSLFTKVEWKPIVHKRAMKLKDLK